MNLAIPLGDSKFALLTNENIHVGDEVFPCVGGYQTNGKFYITYIRTVEALIQPEFVLACTGWPSSPHTVTEFYIDYDGVVSIRTDKGHSPAEVYFKVIKAESSPTPEVTPEDKP